MIEAIGWPLALAVLGAIAGSFLSTLVIRWPAGRSVRAGRSACDGCGATLSAWELVPLVSALALRGRCRRCGAAIDPRHRRIELACAAIGAVSGLAVPGPVAIGGALFGWLLLALAALDAEHFWLPDALTLPLAVLGLVTGLLGWWPPLGDRLWGGAVGYAGLWAIGAAYRRFRGRDGLGGGDSKLLGAIGLWLGWRMLPAVLLLASLTGLALVVAGRARGRRVGAATPVPFGALLAVAAYPAWLVMIGSGA